MAARLARHPRAWSFALGLLAATGQAPLELWPATLLALALWLNLAAQAPAAWTAWMQGWLFGLGYFGATLSWIVEPFLVDAARHAWMAPFALALLAGGLALFVAAPAAIGRGGGAFALAAAVFLAEALRGTVLTGFPWAGFGHPLLGTPLAQGASLGGALGLSLAMLLAAAGLAKLRAGPALVVAATVGAGWYAGTRVLGHPPPADRAATLRLVQPNLAQEVKWDEAKARANLDTLLRLTRTGPPVDLVIWPETAVPYLFEYAPGLAAEIAGAAGGAPVALGIQRVDGERAWNSLRLVDASGGLGAIYDKHHLVPFGEYVPLGDLAYDLFGVEAFAAQAGRTYSAGPGPALLDLGPDLGAALPLICYEAVFPAIPRHAPARADWILQVTNDAWFGTWSGPFQHLAQARFRTIETGLPLVRVANTGVTGVYDARGRPRTGLPFGTEGTLDVALPGALPPPPYQRLGDLPALLLAALVFLAATTAGRMRRVA